MDPIRATMLLQPMQRLKTIYSVPDDIMLIIISFIEVKDILSVRQVCPMLTLAVCRSLVAWQTAGSEAISGFSVATKWR